MTDEREQDIRQKSRHEQLVGIWGRNAIRDLFAALDAERDQNAALMERITNLGEALTGARDVIVAFSKELGRAPMQDGYTSRMTATEHKAAQAVQDLDAIIAADDALAARMVDK